ncbi:MAG: hypothetical protein WBO09_23045 [Methylocystis silviterrae]
MASIGFRRAPSRNVGSAGEGMRFGERSSFQSRRLGKIDLETIAFALV